MYVSEARVAQAAALSADVKTEMIMAEWQVSYDGPRSSIHKSSQIPTRVHLAMLYERLVQASDDALAHRAVRREHVLELLAHALRFLRVLLARVPLRAPAQPDSRDPPHGRGDEARERVRHDQIAQAVSCGQHASPERVRATRAGD